jgi:hypothetical protein
MSKNIDHFTSVHAREVQYSDFIILDSNDQAKHASVIQEH